MQLLLVGVFLLVALLLMSGNLAGIWTIAGAGLGAWLVGVIVESCYLGKRRK